MTDEPGGIELPASNAAAFIRGAINEGMGVNQALNAFQEAGGAMRRQRFLDLFRAETAVASQYPEMLGLDPRSTPQFGAYEPFEMGSSEGYAARVRVTMWDVEAQQFVDQWWLYTKSDPFTIEEAEANAMDMWSGIGDEGRYSMYAVGAQVARVGPIVPYQR